MSTPRSAHSECDLRWNAITKALVIDMRRWALIAIAECDVCAADLASILGCDPPSMSKFLKPLKTTGVVEELVHRDRKLLLLTDIVRVVRDGRSVQILIELPRGFRTDLRFRLPEQLVRCFDEFVYRYPKTITEAEAKPWSDRSRRDAAPDRMERLSHEARRTASA